MTNSINLDKRSFILGLLGQSVITKLAQVGLLSDRGFMGHMNDILETQLNEPLMTEEEFHQLSKWSQEIQIKIVSSLNTEQKICEQADNSHAYK